MSVAILGLSSPRVSTPVRMKAMTVVVHGVVVAVGSSHIVALRSLGLGTPIVAVLIVPGSLICWCLVSCSGCISTLSSSDIESHDVGKIGDARLDTSHHQPHVKYSSKVVHKSPAIAIETMS